MYVVHIWYTQWKENRGTDTVHITWDCFNETFLDIEWTLYISNPLEAENNSIGEQPLFLNNLHTLALQFSQFSAEIIRRTPNLKKLKMCNISDYPSIPDSLILLEELETLKIEVNSIDPLIFSGDVFPPNLKKLTLSNSKIPWEVMNLLSNLPNLEVLEGKYAFAGTDWKLNEDVVFRKLKHLLIRSKDLQRWEAAGSDSFPMLKKLILNWLFELEEIPESIGDIMTLKFIQIVDCSSAVENSAKRIRKEQQSFGNYELQVRITPMVVKKRIKNVVYKAEDKVDSSLRSIILTDCTESREGACKFFDV